MASLPHLSPLAKEGNTTVYRNGPTRHKVECSMLMLETDAGIPSTVSSDSGLSEDSFYSVVEYTCITPPASPTKPAAMATAVPAQMGSKVTDWVQQQACEDNPANNMTDASNAEESAKAPSVFYGTSRRYDIETLLQLRYKVNMSDVKLQINPDVLQGKTAFDSSEMDVFLRRSR